MEPVHNSVGLFTKYLKQIKNGILFEVYECRDYFKIYKNHDVNEFFWLLCIMGGILRFKKVGKKFKIFWLTYHIISASLLIGYNTYVFVHNKDKSLTATLMLLRPISLVWLMIGSHVLSLYFYKSLKKYTDELEEYLSTSSIPEHDQYVAESQFLDTLVFSLLFAILFILGIQFFFPFAIIELEAHSKAIYLILLVAKFVSLLPAMIISYCGSRMTAIYIKKFLHMGNELMDQIKSFSIATLQNLELTHDREMIIESDASILEEREYHLNLLNRRKNAIYENVDKNIAYFAKQRMKMHKINKYLKTYYEAVCSVVFSCICSLQVVLGIHILQVIDGRALVDIWSTTLLILLLCVVTYIVNEDCQVIAVIEDHVQNLCNEVYSIPWYLLPKKNRKMITLLLIQCQQIPQCRIFGMYPFGPPLVPLVLNLGYSYISVLRVIMLKKSK